MKQISDFYAMKSNREPIVMLTAYDYFSGQMAEQSQVDIILVGDSLGNVIQGEGTTIGVTVNQIVYHSKATRKGAPNTFIIADMPYMSYHVSSEQTKQNAAKIMINSKVNAVKLEGGGESRIESIKALVDCEIPVCGHLGLTPQSINMLGDFKVQAKDEIHQEILLVQAKDIEMAGAFMLVLECVPEALGELVADSLHIPVIGIGAGRFTDGQVMVWHDILGMSDHLPKFVKKYVDLKQIVNQNVSYYIEDVKKGSFPEKANVYYPIKNK